MLSVSCRCSVGETMKTLIRAFRKNSIFLYPTALSFTSILLLIASSVIGAADVLYRGKQVGYASAPNWFLSPVLLFPIVGALAILIIRWMDRTLAEMVRRRMLFDTTRNTAARVDSVGRQWSFLLGIALCAWIVLSIGGFAASIKEWWDYSYFPLTRYDTLADLEQVEQEIQNAHGGPAHTIERDWAIAPLFKSGVNRTATYLFSLAAFLVQGWMLSFLALFLVVGVAFGALMVQLSGPDRITIVPDLGSSDKRKGFEIFQDLGGLILLASLCLFFAFFLTMLQNVYLNGSEAESLFQMLYEPFKAGIDDEDGTGWKALLTPRIPTDYSSSYARLGGIVVILLVLVLVPALLLRYAARRAQSNLRRLADLPGSPEIFGRDTKDLKKIAENMEAWPYRYFSLNMLLAGAVVLATLLFWPQIAAYFYGVILAVVIPWALTRFREKVGAGKDGSSAGAAESNDAGDSQNPEINAGAPGPRNGRRRRDGR